MKSLALLCDTDGRILRELCGPDSGGRIRVGVPFVTILEPDSVLRGRELVSELLREGLAIDYRLRTEQTELCFCGAARDGELLILAASTIENVGLLFEEASIPDFPVLRRVLGCLRQTRAGEELFEELSRLNNDLTNSQRELARKNRELERMRAELELHNQELADLNAQKNQLIGMAAHDLRNPLSIILLYSELLRDPASPIDSAERLTLAKEIGQLSRSLAMMVEDMLDVSSIEAGNLNLRLAPVNLVQLILHEIELVRPVATGKEIGLAFQSDAPDIRVNADAGKLSQVVTNLVTNAIKFSHRSSRVQLTVTHDDTAVRIAVADEGQGIPPEEIERLFQPFARISVRPTAGERSTGLGLAIVKRIVEGHDGSIDVSSEQGRGSTFTVTLPLLPSTIPAAN